MSTTDTDTDIELFELFSLATDPDIRPDDGKLGLAVKFPSGHVSAEIMGHVETYASLDALHAQTTDLALVSGDVDWPFESSACER